MAIMEFLEIVVDMVKFIFTRAKAMIKVNGQATPSFSIQ